MTPAALFAIFRSEVNDTALPYLWSDADVWSYMDHAQVEFVRGIGGIRDSSTASVCQLAATAATKFTQYHASILNFRRAQRASDFRKVDIIDYNDLETIGTDDYGSQRPYRLDNTQGPVQAMITGLEEQKVRWISVPDVDTTVEVIVDRLPLTTITGAGGDTFELRQELHLSLLHWMKHRAYSKEDAETFDKGKAQDFLQNHYGAVAAALEEQKRRRHKARTVQYGGL